MDDDNGGLDTRLTLLGPDGAILDGGVGRSKISDLFLAESGRYTILPDGYGSSGAYTLLLTEATVKSILPNEQVSGDIEDDTRWDFEGQAGQIVSIAMNEDDGTLDTRLTLLGPDGTILCTDDDSGDDANSLIRNSILPQDGSYTILPSAYSPSGTYTLLRTEVTRQPITFTELIKGNVEDGVVWTFEGSVGQIISIAMDEDDGTLDTWLTLLGPDGTILSTDDDSGDNTNSLIHNFALSENGSYTILPVGYSPTGAYTLLLTEVTHQPIAFDELIQGDIEDHVAWDFAGQAGQIVRVAMSKAGSGLDTRLTLLGPDGTIQSADNDSGYDTNSLIRGVYLPQDGVYTVLPDGYGSSGEYILILTEATVRPMNFGEMVEGDFEDDAVWAFEAQDEKIVRIEVNPDDSDVYTRLKWGKSDGTTLFTNSARGSLAVTLSLPLSGTYTLEPRGIEEGAGSYSLVLDEITTEGLLSYGDVISDEVTAASGDYWTFSGDSGDVVTIGMSSDSIHPYLQVHSPNGILLPQDASSGPNDDAEITFTLGSGTYIIVARGVDDSETGPYTLSLTQTETPPQSCSPYDPVGKEKR